ncbi:hypothetical protein D7D81_07700 [Halocella sp. SP3-1]|nr:hypothetical protein [Halocella sp. SP3-1]AZO94485.1 hypothetical protein D7D81_07700 [Halocella sp. SP3-1]
MSNEVTKKVSTRDLKRVLGFWDLMGTAVGQIIGAGIMSLAGVAIAMTELWNKSKFKTSPGVSKIIVLVSVVVSIMQVILL